MKKNDTSIETSSLNQAQFPQYIKLTGKFITLQQLDIEEDIPQLYMETHKTEHSKEVWRYLPYGPFNSLDEMKKFYKDSIVSNTKLIFCVKEKNSNKAIGIISLEDIKPEMATIELGGVLYPKIYQRTEANTETVYLLITYCIEDLGYRKIVWRCNNKNLASKNSALRLGFEFEGIFYQHMIAKGQNRDTAWFGLIKSRWPAISENYIKWLYENDIKGRGSLAQMNKMIPGISRIVLIDDFENSLKNHTSYQDSI